MNSTDKIKIGQAIVVDGGGHSYRGMIGVVTSIRRDGVYADWGEPHCGNGYIDISQVSIVTEDWDE